MPVYARILDIESEMGELAKEYLKNLEASETQINTLIKKLESISYINDERYTESFVSEYIRKKKGSKYIEQTLGLERQIHLHLESVPSQLLQSFQALLKVAVNQVARLSVVKLLKCQVSILSTNMT